MYIMALYIHPENQQLLWKIANKNPMVQEYFAAYPPTIQETWFKQVISSFYEQNRHTVSTSEQLYEINKNTLNYMVQDVKRNIQFMLEQKQRLQEPAANFSPPLMPQTYSVTENKEDRFISQYNQYQQNYHTMFDKKVPDSIDFREKIDDAPISGNMEDLIQKHLRERDEELKRYAPTPFFGQGLKQESDKPNSNRLTIDPAPNNIQIAIDELSQENFLNSAKLSEERGVSAVSKDHKGSDNNDAPRHREPPVRFPVIKRADKQDATVKWLDNENSDKIQSLEQEITMLKNQVLQMSDKISFLINVNKDIFDFSAQRLRMSNVTISGGFLFEPPENN